MGRNCREESVREGIVYKWELVGRIVPRELFRGCPWELSGRRGEGELLGNACR